MGMLGTEVLRMGMLRMVVCALLVVMLAGCAPDDGGDDSGSGGSTPPAAYQVLDEDCPAGWTGLTVTTDSDAEVGYLDDMPACTNASGDTTYLENRSDAVWLLRSASTNSGSTAPIDLTLGEQSFVDAVAGTYPGEAIFVPGAKLTVDLAPEEVEWVIDLPLSFGWQAHDAVLEKIEGAGEAAAIAALKRQSPAGGALAVCTLAATNYAKTVAGLDEADTSEVLLDGLGVGVAGSKCRSDAAAVGAVDEAGQSLTLADDLERLHGQSEILERIHVRLGYAQRASKVLGLGLAFLH